MRFGVVGDPVSHSRSPAMHNAGYLHLGIQAIYELIPTRIDDFDDIVGDMTNGLVDGVNVTMPHKKHAFEASDVLSHTARRLGAVNTLVFRDRELHGYNTDVDGVRVAHQRLSLSADTPVRVLGSGGAAAAALVALEGSCPLSIAARNQVTASTMCDRVGVDTTLQPWGSPAPGAITINATPVGMKGEALPGSVLEGTVGLIDMSYGNAVTPAIEIAIAGSIPYADGLVMLAGQAREAFRLFTGRDVPLDVLEAAGRAS